MRVVIPSVITEDAASDLASIPDYLDFSDVRLGGILDVVGGLAPIKLCEDSYARVEKRTEGHPWHQDTGTKGHMEWCKYSASVLLVPPSRFSGGGFYFRDQPDDPIFHFCDLLVFSSGSDNVHSVSRNSGERISLIMFFGGSEDG
tara:strand:- start:216 stop:650 length:435 start_codon:yes stop_codon:yes gene_type:complete